MFEPDEFQRKALETWYKPENPLHFALAHPAIKLAGEAGELLDLYGKNEYKPGFDWWRCTYCGVEAKWLNKIREIREEPHMSCCKYGPFPLVLNELGDFSYYLRILTYQQKLSFIELTQAPQHPHNIRLIRRKGVLEYLSNLALVSSDILNCYLTWENVFIGDLEEAVWMFVGLLEMLECPLEHLIELNYQKLHGGDNHGWKEAR